MKHFDDDLEENDLIVDPPEIVEDIDVTEIEEAATRTAFALCKNLREIYFDEEFMGMHPKLKERLDAEIESLRVLVKMRKSDERIHDLCLRSIGMNSNNASLYAALARIQTSLLRIQQQMDETVKNINSILKNTQLELNFDKPEDSQIPIGEQQLSPHTTRGSKDFVNQMRAELEREDV